MASPRFAPVPLCPAPRHRHRRNAKLYRVALCGSDVCWYLDSTFCATFHSAAWLRDFIAVTFAMVWSAAIIGAVFLIYQMLVATFWEPRRRMIAIGDDDSQVPKRSRGHRLSHFLLTEFSHGKSSGGTSARSSSQQCEGCRSASSCECL